MEGMHVTLPHLTTAAKDRRPQRFCWHVARDVLFLPGREGRDGGAYLSRG